MRKIRVNTGVNFSWTLYLGENTVDWAYYDLTLEMTKPSHAKEIVDFTIDGSVLKFNYKPNQCGQYIISAYLNRYKPDESILDNKIFEAVRWSWNTFNESDDSLASETLELEGNINTNTGGGNSYGDIDLSNYYTKEEINNKLETVVNVESLESYNFATESWVTANYQPKGDYQPAGNYLTSIPSEYITESELETRLEGIGGGSGADLTKYATKQWVEDKGYLTSVPAEYVTETELEEAINNIDIPTVDFTGYATESWVTSNYQPKGDYQPAGNYHPAGDYLTSIPDEYITESELADKDYVTNEYLKSKQYITQADLAFGDFNLDGYYTKFEADEIFVQKGEVNMDDYATIYQVQMKQDKLVSGTNIKTVNGESIVGEGNISFDEFANKQEALVSGVNIKTINGQSILGEGDIMITGGDTPDMTGYVTTIELNNKGFITSIPEEELNARNYATVDSVEAKQNVLVAGQNIKTINGKSILGGGNLVISGGSSEVDLTGYATESWVTANYQPKGDYQPAGDYLTSIPDEYVTESELETRLEGIGGGSDLTGYATEQWVEDKGYLTSIPDEYITEDELTNKGYITSIPSEYVTETELNNKGYITSIPNNYVTGDGVTNIRKMTQAAYNSITPNENTLYIIVG